MPVVWIFNIIFAGNQKRLLNKPSNCWLIFDFMTLTASTSWWRHQMETVSALLAICAGNSPVPGEYPHKGQWRGALMFSLIWARINGWVNNPEAGDLRRHPTHCDVIVMSSRCIAIKSLSLYMLSRHCQNLDVLEHYCVIEHMLICDCTHILDHAWLYMHQTMLIIPKWIITCSRNHIIRFGKFAGQMEIMLCRI